MSHPAHSNSWQALGSRVESRDIPVEDLTVESVGSTFDVVLFLGVLYHMRDPFLAVEKVSSVCAGHLILETHVDLLQLRRPAVALYDERDLDRDPTNWCGPNVAGVELMLRRAGGFQRVEVHWPKSGLYNLGRFAVNRARRKGVRMVFHAFR